MKWLITFTNSSIGKKYLMGTTGLLLCLFIAQHLIGNIMLFGGKDMFNTYVKTLSSFKPLVRTIEVVLTIIFVIHIIPDIMHIFPETMHIFQKQKYIKSLLPPCQYA